MIARLQPILFPGVESVELPEKRTASPLRLLAFFEHSPLPMWIFDPDRQQFLAVNDAAVRYSGWSRHEFLGMTLAEVLPGAMSPGFQSTLREARIGSSGTKNAPDLQHLTKSGRTLRIEFVWHAFEYEGRRAIHITIIDRTAQYETAEENRDLAEVLNLASDAIVVCDLEHKVSFWNQGAVKLYGWSAEEAMGRNVNEIFKIDADVVRQCTQALSEAGEWQGQMNHARKQGPIAIVNSRWTLARNESSKQPKCILLINSDITETKKLESQFLRAQRLDSLGTLASGIAHDLNNILSPILMASGILSQSKLSEDESKMLAIIEGSAERGAGIVKQVLTFARGADGERVPLQTKHIVTEMAKVMVQTFPKNLDIQTNFPRDLWMVTGDATQIHQILLNLCVNARDAIGDNAGTIRVECKNVEIDQQTARANPGAQSGPHVCISVKDTGAGMSPDVMEKIFDPFFTTKEQGKGTGLGLATVLGIVKGHKGFVTLQSQVGVGTTFRVFLPANTDAADTAEAETDPSSIRGRGETLLVVDDEAAVREALVTTLHANGYHCYTAEDGTDALALFFERRDNISAIITDLHMGIMDGIALVRSLRKVAPETRVIVSSGHISDEKRVVLKGLGVESILEKPYSAEKLLRSVHDILKRGR
jgi:two-component system, cell cycle sensor histidine kinase and response regulator CckA